MEKFIKGPWYFEADAEDDMVYVCHQKTVCPGTVICAFEGEDPADKHNAHLIAAAPEMYEALKRMCINGLELGYCAESDCQSCNTMAALKKARGES